MSTRPTPALHVPAPTRPIPPPLRRQEKKLKTDQEDLQRRGVELAKLDETRKQVKGGGGGAGGVAGALVWPTDAASRAHACLNK